MEKFATGGIAEKGLFIEREDDVELVGKIGDKKIVPHAHKLNDSIAEAVAKKLSHDFLNFDYFPQFPSAKSDD